jgi:hypothetical protein
MNTDLELSEITGRHMNMHYFRIGSENGRKLQDLSEFQIYDMASNSP